MNNKLIQLYERSTFKSFPFKTDGVEYQCIKIDTIQARSLYKLRFKNNKITYSPQRVIEFKNLIKALDEFNSPVLLTHIIGPDAPHSLILFTDTDITFLIGTLTSTNLYSP